MYLIFFSFFYFCRFLTTKDTFHGFLDSEWRGSKTEKATENEEQLDNKNPSVEEPESKKPKLDPEDVKTAEKPDKKRFRGQNKSRPHTKPTTYEEKRLCLSVIQVEGFYWILKHYTAYSTFRYPYNIYPCECFFFLEQ